MRGGRYFRFRRTRAALYTGVIVAGLILVPSAGGRPLQAVPLGAFDSNGLDDSFLVAQSRPEGPVITASTDTQSAAAIEVAGGDPVAGSFGPQVAWPIMPIHAVLLPDGRVMSYGTDPNGVQTAYYQYDVWNPQLGTASHRPHRVTQWDGNGHFLQLPTPAAERRRRGVRRRQPPGGHQHPEP